MSQYFHVETRDGIAVVHFDDEIVPDARDPIYGLVGHERLVLNLTNIKFLSTLGLGVLANLQRRVNEAGGRLRLCCLGPNVTSLFRMTKFDQIFDIYGSQEEALRDF